MGTILGILRVVGLVAGVVRTVEREAGPKKGVDKQDMAVGIIKDIMPIMADEPIISASLPTGGMDPELEKVIRLAIDMVVALMNLRRSRQP